jgi:hypothetical protein
MSIRVFFISIKGQHCDIMVTPYSFVLHPIEIKRKEVS